LSKLDIIYEDDSIVVINKEAGMLTVADRWIHNSVHLQSILRKKYGEIYTIHRLDKETSGVICFAKNADVHKILSEQFETREVEKYYLALVSGELTEDGFIDQPLVPSETRPGTTIIHRKGKPSYTSYKVVENYSLFTVVDVRIHTGRMHQIRVHFAFIGHPLFIDSVYGRREHFMLSELKGRKYKAGKFTETDEKPLMSRLTLHSSRLILEHPITKQKMEFKAEIPKDIKALIHQFDKYDKKKSL
jgi:23S rRNA pseudouridine1911/1915/1917 synthase